MSYQLQHTGAQLDTAIQNVLNSYINTSDATAVAADMLSGKTAYVNGVKVTGNIPSKAVQTYTPSTSNQTITAGQYLSGTQTIEGDADLIADNIRSGVNIFGVLGTYTGGGGGGTWQRAQGTVTQGVTSISASGLSFAPKAVVFIADTAMVISYLISAAFAKDGDTKPFITYPDSSPGAIATQNIGSITFTSNGFTLSAGTTQFYAGTWYAFGVS